MSAAPEHRTLPLDEGREAVTTGHLPAEDPRWLQGSSAHEVTGKDKQPLRRGYAPGREHTTARAGG